MRVNIVSVILGLLSRKTHGTHHVRVANDPVTEHRVFPAAQSETYSSAARNTAGRVQPKDLQFTGSDFSIQNAVIKPAIERFQKSLYRLPDYKEVYEENPERLDLTSIHTVDVHVNSPDTNLYHGVDESYTIIIDELSHVVNLRAGTIFGALYALETFAQLLEFGWMADDEPVYLIRGIPLMIVDEPAYTYRGLLMDTARHYLPMSLILDTLQTMSMNKMNVLHWHIVDDQSFPYQMETHPEIAEKGSYPPFPHRIYTSDDIRLVIHEAYKVGIRVIPEVDLPGHTFSIGHAHPELMAFCPDAGSVVDATKPEVYSFVEDVYNDLNNLFPDRMVHVGGDEVDLSCWSKSDTISQWMKEHNMTDPIELYEYFETRLLRVVDSFEKTPIVWQEVVNQNLTLTPTTIVDVWKGFDVATIEEAARRNFSMVLSGCWYLDHLDKTWTSFYDCDPRNFTGNRDLMLGGHASMWGEHVDASNIVSRIWPRASAAAERLWRGDLTKAKLTVDARIHKFRCRMVQQGIAAAPTVSHGGYCPHEVPYLREYDEHRSRCDATSPA
jgi:hexosaminidase